MVERMIRGAKGDIELYEEVEHAPSLTQEAYTVVGIVAVVTAIGGLLFSATGNVTIGAAISQGILVFVGYLVWSYLTFLVGTNLFNGVADYGELQRTIAYAMTPQMLTFIPVVNIFATLWSLYLGFVAVRQALDVDNTKALVTVVLAFIPYVVVMGIITIFI
ncbi:MAG: YIP1 family protein [Ardenticatenaceae bacterium]